MNLSPLPAARYVGQSILDFIYPSYCTFCNLPLRDARMLACDDCWNQLPLYPEDRSIRQEMEEKLDGPIYISRAVSRWEFSENIQFIIHRLKYNHHRKVADILAQHMVRMTALFPDADLIVPVPLHKRRLRERGYNQSALIGKMISKLTRVPLDEKCISRCKNTISQTKLNIGERLENVTDAFHVNEHIAIKDRTILLIDDVITTGSTINACARQLMAHGARSVIALSAAKA